MMSNPQAIIHLVAKGRLAALRSASDCTIFPRTDRLPMDLRMLVKQAAAPTGRDQLVFWHTQVLPKCTI